VPTMSPQTSWDSLSKGELQLWRPGILGWL
jgi:hypothetical protein